MRDERDVRVFFIDQAKADFENLNKTVGEQKT